MSVGLSPGTIVWIIALASVVFVVTIWAIYKIFACYKQRQDTDQGYQESMDSGYTATPPQPSADDDISSQGLIELRLIKVRDSDATSEE